MGPTLASQKERKGNVSLPTNHPILSDALKLLLSKILCFPCFFFEKSHKLNPKRKVTRPPQPYKTPYPPLNSSSKAAAEHLDGLVRLELAEVENPRNCRPDLLVEGLVGKISSQRKDVCLFFLVKENSWLGWLIVIVWGWWYFFKLVFCPEQVNVYLVNKVAPNRTIWRPDQPWFLRRKKFLRKFCPNVSAL